MRCIACCSATYYQLGAIASYFKAQHYKVQSFRRVLFISKKGFGDVFVFPHGCFVTWGLTRKEEIVLLEQINAFAVKPLAKVELDYFIFQRKKKNSIYVDKRFDVDVITLNSNDIEDKLAISYGVSQSVKLSVYEDTIQKVIEKNAYLPSLLAEKGRIPLSKKVILQRMGEIFTAKNLINLNSEFLDVPEHFWEYASGEELYLMSTKFFDLSKRVNSLNQKLGVLKELFEMLTNQLQHRHSSFLEWIIIWLIAIEIAISITTYFWK
jgi:uncharacterized Rmd1/YagE family protein